MMKTCFKCGIEKSLGDFYVHKQMADGHLNKCKECTKSDTKYHSLYLKETDPNYVEKEKKRGRHKYRRLYSGIKKNKETHERATKKWIDRFPEKRRASIAAQHIKSTLGNNHHWSYREEHWKDVIDITVKDHAKAHRFIVYDQEQMMYRRVDTMELLDTKEKHLEWIKYCIENKED